MYMNGRGPMGGHRGPMGGPGFRPMGGPGFRPMGGPGFGPGFRPMRGPMYHRPMGMWHHRPMGLGGLFLLPALMFGGWIVVAVLGGVLALVGSMFEGFASLASGAFTGGGLVPGIVIGLVAYYVIRNRKAKETASTIDDEEVETEIVEPVHYSWMGE